MEQVKYRYNSGQVHEFDNGFLVNSYTVHGEHKWVDGQELIWDDDFEVDINNNVYPLPIVNKQPMQRVYLAKGSKYKLEGESILRDALIDENGNYYYKQPMKEGNDDPLLPETVNKETRPEDLAREIVNYPNLWGMYSIADAIHNLLKFQKEGNDIANGRDEVYYKWIKASDELPTEDGSYFCREIGNGKKRVVYFSTNKIRGSRASLFYIKPFKIEWLKPVESLPTNEEGKKYSMKNLVAGIFGKEASEDKDIVDFYTEVNKTALQEVEEGKLDKAIDWCDEKIKLMEQGLQMKSASNFEEMKQYLQSLKNN